MRKSEAQSTKSTKGRLVKRRHLLANVHVEQIIFRFSGIEIVRVSGERPIHFGILTFSLLQYWKAAIYSLINCFDFGDPIPKFRSLF